MLISNSDGLECDGELWAILMVGLAIVEVGVVYQLIDGAKRCRWHCSECKKSGVGVCGMCVTVIREALTQNFRHKDHVLTPYLECSLTLPNSTYNATRKALPCDFARLAIASSL